MKEDRFLDRISPADYRADPEQALEDVRVRAPIRSAIESMASDLGLSLDDEEKADEFDTGKKRNVSLLRGGKHGIYLLQVPAWIIDDGKYVPYFDSLRFAFAGSVVRVCAEGLDAPARALKNVLKYWKRDASLGIVHSEFIPWRYLADLDGSGTELTDVLNLEAEWIAGNGGVESPPKGPAPKTPDPAPPMAGNQGPKKLRIFLASSSELKSDRDGVETWIGRLNKRFIDKGIYIHLDLWEDFLDAIAIDGLQSKYNEEIRKSDLLICLFKKKVGKFTEEEFDIALASMKSGGKPRYIYTYFRKITIDPDNAEDRKAIESRDAFIKRLEEMKHYRTFYSDTNDLKIQLRRQIDEILDAM